MHTLITLVQYIGKEISNVIYSYMYITTYYKYVYVCSSTKKKKRKNSEVILILPFPIFMFIPFFFFCSLFFIYLFYLLHTHTFIHMYFQKTPPSPHHPFYTLQSLFPQWGRGRGVFFSSSLSKKNVNSLVKFLFFFFYPTLFVL